MIMILRSAFMDWPFGGYLISLCPNCPHVHFQFYKNVDDEVATLSLDINVAELDALIEALVEVRNEARLRPAPPVTPTHDAPETTQ